MMDGKASLKDDLSILLDMYPELHLDTELNDIDGNVSTPINGYLPFKIVLSSDLKIEFNNQTLILTQMVNDVVFFSIIPSKYPSLRDSIEFAIQSKWMSQESLLLIEDAIHTEFDELTDSKSSLYDPLTPILMLFFGFLMEDSAALLFKNNLITCTSEVEYQKFVDLHNDVEHEKLGKSNFNCVICMETKKGVSMIRLPCNHFLCIDCTKSYFQKMIAEGNIKQVRCPECEYKELDLSSYQDYSKLKKDLFAPSIPFEFFNGILSDELCQRYRNLFNSHAAIRLSKHCIYACVTCPRCEAWCIKDDLNDLMIQCQKCEFAFCFNCHHSWHGYNNKCGKKLRMPSGVIEEYMDSETNAEQKRALEAKYGKKILEREVGEYLADKMLDMAIAKEGSDLQRCPQCLLVIQRSEGCNKMKCSVCNTLFCYICGDLLYPSDPYEHYREAYSPCYGRLFEGMPGAES